MEKLQRIQEMTQSLLIMFSPNFFSFEQDNQRKEYNVLNTLEKNAQTMTMSEKKKMKN